MKFNIDYIKTVFEYQELTKIVGLPTYASLKQMKDECAANASRVISNHGGGAHRLLGLILTAPKYALVSPIPFVRPGHPGAFVIPHGPSVTNFQRDLAKEQHQERVRGFHEII